MLTTDTQIETQAPAESVFQITIKRCPPKAIGTRSLLELLDHYNPDVQPDENLRQADGNFLPQAAAYTCLRHAKDVLGPIHPAVSAMMFDLREEWAR
jgi:hypothetical protein